MDSSKPASPRPLDDPLRDAHRFYKLAVVAHIALAVIGVGTAACGAIAQDGFLTGTGAALAFLGAFGASCLIPVLAILPSRKVGILYLRSFRNDRSTAGVRQDIDQAIGHRVRVSGIRAPGLRWPRLLRYIAIVPFAFRYLTPVYMNLEAGRDWKRRVWDTLDDVRGAIVDVTELTEHVVAEIRMCALCLPADRILFVVDDSLPPEDWEARLRSVCPELASGVKVDLAVWSARPDARSQFQAEVADFEARLPASSSGCKVDVEQRQRLLGGFEAARVGSTPWQEILAAFLIGSAVALFVPSTPADGFVTAALAALAVAYWLLMAYCFVRFLFETSTFAKRRQGAVLLLSQFVVPATVFCLMPTPAPAREAANRTMCQNNLKQIALAMHSHHDTFGGLPQQASRGWDGRSSHSWRTQALPFVEQQAVYERYDFAQPWDSPNNLAVGAAPIPTYSCPSHGDRETNETSYFVVYGDETMFAPNRSLKLSEVPDGLSDTILIVESHSLHVPWAQPVDIPFDRTAFHRNESDSSLTSGHRGGVNVALADGSVRFVPDSVDEQTIRYALIRNDGTKSELP